MTGPEHYGEAERLVGPRTVHSIPSGEPREAPPTMDMILQAQVHATLALAAATALQDRPVDRRAWEELGTPKPLPGPVV
ncbi:MAG: hypothetical protein QOE61_3049 [Micromonosporaceae bacterium]|uniref:hypothetical protein n=1 Tax=Mycobacterium sp. TaxID=1785 RepID=UPI0028B27CBF|nr:hypothetical protein [Mycobacterium sp.]MDT5026623.1 hypothetical protein [Micromonosporaceae bacterium]MDT5119277.1 hypothetical protein [Mycobacterium sp.]